MGLDPRRQAGELVLGEQPEMDRKVHVRGSFPKGNLIPEGGLVPSEVAVVAAHGRHPAEQSRARLRLEITSGGVEADVEVGVDETREQGSATGLDDLSGTGQFRSDLGDAPVLDGDRSAQR